MALVEFFYILGTLTLPLMGIRPITNLFSLSDLFYFAALFCLIVYGISHKEMVSHWMPLRPFWLPAILILAGGILASIYSAVSLTASLLATVKTWFLYSLWMSMGIVLARDGGARKILTAFLVGAVFAAAVAILDSRTGLNIGPAIFKLTGNWSGVDPVLYNLIGRYPGPTSHPNALAQFTVVAMPIALLWWLKIIKDREWLWSIVLGISLVLLGWGITLTGSVAGLISGLFSLGVVFIVLLLRTFPSERPLFYSIVFLFMAILFFSIALFGTSLLRFTDHMIASNDNIYRALTITGPGRINLNLEGLSLILQSPWLGYGMDQGTAGGVTGSQLVTSEGVHNTLLRMWLAGGLLSFLGLLIIYIISVNLAFRTLVNFIKKTQTSYIAAGLSISILGWVLADMAQPSFFLRFTWLTVGILYGMCSSVFQQKSQTD